MILQPFHTSMCSNAVSLMQITYDVLLFHGTVINYIKLLMTGSKQNNTKSEKGKNAIWETSYKGMEESLVWSARLGVSQ